MFRIPDKAYLFQLNHNRGIPLHLIFDLEHGSLWNGKTELNMCIKVCHKSLGLCDWILKKPSPKASYQPWVNQNSQENVDVSVCVHACVQACMNEWQNGDEQTD